MSFSGTTPGTSAQMTQLRFPEELLPDLVYQEQLESAIYLNKPADTVHYWNILNSVVTEALPPEQSAEMLRRLADLI